MSHNHFPPPQQSEWSDVDPDRGALEFMQQFRELCNLWVSPCVGHRQLTCDQSWTGNAIETPAHDSSFGPRRLGEPLWGCPQHFSQDWHKIWCTLAVPFSDPSWKLPQVTYTTRNKRVLKLPTSVQLHATWHTRHGSPTIYRCFALSQLLYRWRHHTEKFWIPPCIRSSLRVPVRPPPDIAICWLSIQPPNMWSSYAKLVYEIFILSSLLCKLWSWVCLSCLWCSWLYMIHTWY
jgi:hypothetical protein